MKNLITYATVGLIFFITMTACPWATAPAEDIESRCVVCMEAYRQAYQAARAAGNRNGGCPRNSEAVFASFKKNIERSCGTTAYYNAMITDGCLGMEFTEPPCPFN